MAHFRVRVRIRVRVRKVDITRNPLSIATHPLTPMFKTLRVRL